MATATTPDTAMILHHLGNEIQALVQGAGLIEITDQPSYDAAAAFLRRMVERRKKIDETFDPISEKQFAAFKETKAQKARFVDPTIRAEQIVKGKIIVWNQEQERIRQEEQRRLEEQARVREEDERLQAAMAAEEEGAAPEEVAAILETPEPHPATVAPRTYQPAQGISKPRETWSAQVVNLLELIRFVATNPQELNLLIPNQVALNERARSAKNLLALPGVRIVRQQNISVRMS